MIISVVRAERIPALLAKGALALGLLSSLPAFAQIFDAVPQLAFTKPFAGADPLPQIMTVASPGANFNFTATATTSSGGAWLSISPQGIDCCITPEAITVTVTAPPALAPGTYQGQITVKSYPVATALMNVPVTLTIAAASGAFFDNVPGQLSFSLQTGGVAPPSQVVQIRNKGTGSLDWTVASSTADGGSWLGVAPTTGTAPSTLTVAIVPASLPGGGLSPGTFVGDLVFTASGSSVTIPIAVVVGNSVFSQVNPISFTMPLAGKNPLPQTLTIASTGSNFNFTAAVATATGGAWLQVSPLGTDCCIAPEAVTVSVTAPAGLAAGTYTGEVIFTQYPSRNFSMTVPVTLTVAAGVPFLDNLPGELNFSLTTGGAAPPFQLVQIRNAGTGTLGWSLSKSTADGGSWLNVSATTGNAPSLVAVAIVPANLPNGGLVAGTFVGQLAIASASGSATIPVTVVVGNSVFSQVNPISFTMPAGGANPLPQILTVASTGNAFNFTASAATATGGAWLQVSPQGTDCCIAPEAVTVSVTAPPGLAAGTYTGQVVFTQYPSRSFSMTVPVTLTVAPATVPSLDNLPGQLSYSLKTGGGAPPSQSVQIRNKGTGTLGWGLIKETADGGSWLNVSATTGNAPSTVSVSIVPGSLPGGGLVAGTFVGQVLVVTASSIVTIPIAVVVGNSVFSQVNPIGFTMPLAGKNPLPQTLTIASTGSNFNFTAAVATASGGAWLQVSPLGTDCCIAPEAITVSVTAPAGLAAGTYTGEVIFTQYPSRNFSMTVPVTLTVAAGVPFLDNLPGELNFSLTTGGAAPPFQLVQIRNAGTGTLGWSLSKSTADGGSWLNASATTGNAPSLVAVAIVPANLPNGGLVAGTFVGQLAIASASGSATIPVTVVVGNSVFSQDNPISFTMPAGGANPLPQILTVASTGNAFNFTASAATATGGAWLQVSPQGTDCCIAPEAVTVSVTAPPGLAAGTYTGEVVFTQYPSRSFSMTVPVTLTVAAGAPFLDNLSGGLSFSLKTGGAAPPFQLVQIRNGGTGTLNWGLVKGTADGGNWLNVSATQGTGPSILGVSITPANLPGGGLVAGTFVGQVLIATASSIVTIPVSVVVGDPVFSQVNPISFTMPAGGANPLPQILTVASTGSAFNFTATVATATGGNWLQISPQGTDCCVVPEAITVSVAAPAGLAAGTYTGEIILTQYPSRNMSMIIPVALTVAASGAFFDNVTGQLSFFMSPGGGAPANQVVQIRNGGSGTLTWGSVKSTADGGTWLSATPAQGAAPSAITVGITPGSLPGGGLVAGTYVGQILIASAASGVTIPVSVVVGDPLFATAPSSLSFSMPVGINPPSQPLAISSSSSAISFSAVAATGTGGAWLQISPKGTDCCITPAAITVSITAAGLAAGTYTGEVIITQYPSRNKATTVPVYLTVH